MIKPRKPTTKKEHIVFFGFLFVAFIFGITCSSVFGLSLDPTTTPIHTNVVYYDKQFDKTYSVEDTYTALFVVNLSSEILYINVYEYNKNFKEVLTQVTIEPHESKYLKPDGSAVIYIYNSNFSAKSVVKFSRFSLGKKLFFLNNLNKYSK